MAKINGEGIKMSMEEYFDGLLRQGLVNFDAVHKAMSILQKDVKDIREVDLPSLRIDIATLKVKAGMWGAFAGMIPVLIMILLKVFLKI